MSKKALITGITGQDGAYLAEFLLAKGYEVHGIKRRTSLFNTQRIDHLYCDPHEPGVRFFLHHGDMTDSSSLMHIIQKVQPDEIYNLAAQSHVAVSFEEPEYTANADALGTLRLLEAIRTLGLVSKTRFYQASTSELFGKVQEIPQRETTPFYPRSPYAAAKLFAYWITVNYREAYGLYACNGILFNHESPIRGETFVTRKITRALARIKLGLQDCLYLTAPPRSKRFRVYRQGAGKTRLAPARGLCRARARNSRGRFSGSRSGVADACPRTRRTQSCGVKPMQRAHVMPLDARICGAGHRGLVGSALMRTLSAKGYTNLLTRTHAELDLTDQRAVEAFFDAKRPEYVFLAAAKVGGIHANDAYPAECSSTQTLPFRPTSSTQRGNTASSACCFWALPASTRATVRSPSRRNTCSPAPWSPPTGPMRWPRSPASKLVSTCTTPLPNPCKPNSLNLAPLMTIGTGQDITIRELIELVRQVVGYEGEVVFDIRKPDGTPRKVLDVSRIQALEWKAKALTDRVGDDYTYCAARLHRSLLQ